MSAPGPRLLLISHAPGTPTGLGGQSLLVYKAAVAAGFQVVVANLVLDERPTPFPSFYHAQGMIPEYVVNTPLPPDQLGYILTDFDPQAIVALCDAWALGPYVNQPKKVLEKTHLWTTADHEFFPESFRHLYENVASLVFMAHFGANNWGPVINRKDKRTRTIWHAVDGEIFCPKPPEFFKLQKEYFGTEGHFIALHVGRNQHRKQQPLLIEGWARFVRGLTPQERAKCTLYLHTEEKSAPFLHAQADPLINAYSVLFAGIDLPMFIRNNYEAEVQSTIRFSECHVPREGIANMYGLADVHVLTSTGGGFEVPLIEAQACGRANISANNTTTPEIVGGLGALVNEFGTVLHPEGEVDDGYRTPFGWRVSCNSFSVQPDFGGKRPQVDYVELARALRHAWELWRVGQLNEPAAVAQRRNWTLARAAWSLIQEQWTELLQQIKRDLEG